MVVQYFYYYGGVIYKNDYFIKAINYHLSGK